MNYRYRTLVFALAAAATLCWQVPAFADPPSWAHNDGARGHDRDRPENRGDRNYDHRNDQDNRYGREGDRDHDARPGYSGYYGNARYPRYPVYPGHPYYPYYPVHPYYPYYPRVFYPVYPVYPAYPYYSYYGYPGYYGGYYGGAVAVPGPVVVAPGPCNANVALGAAGAVTGAIIGNSASAPHNRAAGTVIGAVAGGLIGAAVGNSIDRPCYPPANAPYPPANAPAGPPGP